MANGDDEPRPRSLTAANVWDRLDHLQTETREARHAQSNLMQRAINENAALIRGEIGTLDVRLRQMENMLAAATPVSLGARINDLEMRLAKADGDTSLVARVNALETAWDKATGSLAFLKVAATVVGLLSGIAAVLSWVSLQAP